jgi:hypothetical protein
MILSKIAFSQRTLQTVSFLSKLPLLGGYAMAKSNLDRFLNHRGSVIQLETTPDSAGRQLRHRSPLLFAVCALHGLRFSHQHSTLLNSPTHRQLYEEVRDMLGQAVLASPLPLDELSAILIMSTFEAAPRVPHSILQT